MRIIVAIPLLFVLAGKSQHTKNIKVHEQQEDFVVLKTSLLQNTGNPYLYTDSTTLVQRMDSVQLLLNKPLSQRHLFRHYSFIVNQVRCGHTQCYPSKKLVKEFLTTPSSFSGDITIVEGKLYVAKNIGKSPAIQKGSEITSINGIPSIKIIARMRNHFSSDGENSTFKDRIFSELFLLYFFLTFDTPKEFQFKFRVGQNTELVKFVRPSLPDYSVYKKKIESSPLFTEPDADDIGSVRINRKVNYALFKFPSFRYSSGKTYQDFLAESISKINKSGVSHLVLDLRDNKGGKPQILLLGHLCKKEESFIKLACNDTKYPTYSSHFKRRDEWYRKYKKIIRITRRSLNMGGKPFNVTLKSSSDLEKINCKLLVLVNGGSFSASANLASNLQSKCEAIVIGQETGGSYAQGNTGQLILKLPNTKFMVTINPIYYDNQVDGKSNSNAGVKPDIKVQEKFGSKRKEDPYIQAAESFIQKAK